MLFVFFSSSKESKDEHSLTIDSQYDTTPLLETITPSKNIEDKFESPTTKQAAPNLKLLATTLSSDPTFTRATIRDKDVAVNYVLEAGDTIGSHEDTVVATIESKRVILDRKGETIELVLDDKPLRDPVPDNWESTFHRLQEYAKRGESYEGLLMLQWQQVGARDEPALTWQASLAPYYKTKNPGKASTDFGGIKVVGITPGSLYQQLGLQSEDVIIEVNNIAMTSVEEADKIAPVFMESESIDLVVLRDGEEISFSSETIPPH